MKLRTGIIATSLSMGTVVILVLGVVMFRLLSSEMEERAMQAHKRILNLVSIVLHNSTLTPDRQQLLTTISIQLSADLTIVGADGTVLFESHRPHHERPVAGSYRSRGELIQAAEGGMGFQRSGEVYSSAMRVTTPLPDGSEGGFILVSTVPEPVSPSVGSLVLFSACSVGLVILITVFSAFMSRRISEPLVTMVRTVDRMRNGEIAARIGGTYPAELAELATAINAMAEKLGADITKRERLERVRSEFLGNVSHELRTPIFSLQGFLETLLDGAVDDSSVNRAFLAKAHAHSERLNTLLNDLIEISRIESGEMKMSFRYFSILEFLEPIIDEFKPVAQTKGISLSLESEFDASAKVYGDRSRLRQVMNNLIDNAIKYTEPGGSVVCVARAIRNQCEILVRDTGNGIPPGHLSRIFERFYRVDKDRSREIGGTGLGLAIVKHIVEAHGSTIEAASTVGQGSVFSFKLKR